jgi:hypothetical protein
MVDPICVQYGLEPRDVEAWWLQSISRDPTRRLDGWLPALLCAGAVGWVAFHIASDIRLFVAAAFASLLAGKYLATVYPRFYIRLVRHRLASLPAERQFGPHQLTIDGSGVSERGPASSHAHSWDAVEGVTETYEHLFIRVGGGGAYSVPKRCITPELVHALKRAVQSRVAG